MAAKMQKEMEVKGKLTESHKDFTEEVMLNQQEFKHDVVLETIKHDAANKEAA